MTTRDFLQIIRRRIWSIVLITLVTVGVVVAAQAYRPKGAAMYHAAATMRLSSASKTTNFDRALLTYAELARSKVVLVEAIRRLNLAGSPTELAEQVTVETVPGTELVRVVGESTDPEQAVALANTVANILVEKDRVDRPANSQTALLESQAKVAQDQLVQDKAQLALLLLNYRVIQPGEQEALQSKIAVEEKAYEDLLAQLLESRVADALNANSLSIYEPALSVELATDATPTSLYLLLAGVTGLMGGLAVAFLQESLDNRVRSAQEIERKLPLPVLTHIPQMPRNAQGKLDEMAVTEAFRSLQAYVWNTANRPAGPIKTVMIASPNPREGKSFIAARLATALAASGHSVILVDMDFRRPTIHTQFGLPNTVGITDILASLPPGSHPGDGQLVSDESAGRDGETLWNPSVALHPTRFPGLRVLTSGPLPPNPVRLLSADRLRQLLNRLAALANVVIVDSPALVGLADGLILAPMVDGVILAASAGLSTHEGLEHAHTLLKRVNANVMGVVLNRARIESRAVYRYYRRPRTAVVRGNPAQPGSEASGEKMRSVSSPQRR